MAEGYNELKEFRNYISLWDTSQGMSQSRAGSWRISWRILQDLLKGESRRNSWSLYRIRGLVDRIIIHSLAVLDASLFLYCVPLSLLWGRSLGKAHGPIFFMFLPHLILHMAVVSPCPGSSLYRVHLPARQQGREGSDPRAWARALKTSRSRPP